MSTPLPLPTSSPARRTLGASHPPLRVVVLEEVRRRIIAHEYEPGQRIFEDQIAAELEVSRNPVREALQALETEGFVELEPRRGARVATLSRRRARELFEVREVLEGLVAQLAARHRTESEIAELRDTVARGVELAASADLAGLPTLNTRFHALLANASRNELLAETIERSQHVIEWVYAEGIRRRAPDSWAEHAQLAEAVARGDEHAAERLARAHIAAARAAIVDTPT
ncbi:MAG TPA: GntR family transcriptional regulator [Ilumatobacter sp.]|nr:GntR family transcriptional regulator [Ilumatobacter sp.]